MTDTPIPAKELREEALKSSLGQVFLELKRVKDDDRLLILVTHGMIELFVNTLVRKRLKNAKLIKENGRDFSHSAKLIILNETGAIPDSTFKVLNWFRKLRNEAAHEPMFKLDKARLADFETPSFRDPKNFFVLCTKILGDVWRDHVLLLVPEFAPKVVAVLYAAYRAAHPSLSDTDLDAALGKDAKTIIPDEKADRVRLIRRS